MDPHPSATRYFGLPVPARVAAAVDERLLDYWVGDRGPLVDAHLARNHPYFGAIDKSLSGFVIIDDEGDDYTLLDLRGDGRVWWQDHETRELALCFDSFDVWLAYRDELERAAADDTDERSKYDIRESFLPASAPDVSEPTPTSAELAERYQWLMWLLARPLLHDGQPMQSAEALAASAAGHYADRWSGTDVDKVFELELPLLHGDPHLALYWLLHTALLARDADRARVLDEIARAADRPELLDAFVAVFGRLPLDGDVPAVDDFRIRRALLQEYAADDEQRARAALTALEIAPEYRPLVRASWIVRGLDDGTITGEQVNTVLDRVPDTTGTALLRAELDRRAGRDHSPAADALARLVPTSACEWQTRLWAISTVAPLVRNGAALAEAARELLGKDPYSRPCLTLLRRAHELGCGEAVLTRAELDRRWGDAEASASYLERLRAAADDAAPILTELAGTALGEIVAQRVLLRADIDEPEAAVIGWALRTILDGSRADRADLAAIGLRRLPTQDRTRTVGRLRVDAADSPVVAVLIHLLEHTPEPAASDILGEMYNDELKEAVCLALAPVAHEPPVFDELLRLAGLPAPGGTVEALWEQLFDASEPHCVLPRLSPEQAVRAATTMIETIVTHPAIGARNAAGHQLYRFRHPGAQDFLIAALDDYGRRYADSDPAHSPELSHGQTLDDQLGEVVANLYAAVRQVNSAAARGALIERLFTERRSIWRMGDALGEVFSAQVHRDVMRRLRERRDPRAAANYANALVDHVGQRWPRVELLREISGWPAPTDPVEQRVFKFALSTGILAALEGNESELVRAAHAAWAALPVAAVEPDSLVRGRDWADPLEASDTRARLAEVLSGATDSARLALRERGERARAARRPLTRITDAELAGLAGVTPGRRLLADRATGEVWFLDAEHTVFCFDGFGMCHSPFRSTVLGYDDLRDFLGAVPEQSERVLLWTRAGKDFVELVRYVDRVVYRWGVDNGHIDALGLTFADQDAAAHAVARMTATCLAAKYTASDPWYRPGRAAILRTFRRPDADNEYLTAFDRLRFAVDPATAAAHERRELELYREGAVLTNVETVSWDADRLRTDMTVAEWVRARIRDDQQDPVWHVRALAEIAEYLTAQGFTTHIPELADLHVELGPPAAPGEIDTLAAELGTPLPASLRALWERVGHAEWRIGDTGLRLLGPAEVRRERPRSRRLGAKYAAALRGEQRTRWEPALTAINALVVGLDGSADTVFTDLEAVSDDRVFTHLDQHPAKLSWQSSLSWIVATSFLSRFADHLEQAAPDTLMLFGGQRRGPDLSHRYFEAETSSGTKFWEIVTDPHLDILATRHGREGTVGIVSVERHGDPAKATAQAAKAIAAKQRGGYREITD
ncbi:Uncharacterised protein [Nocardia otitidiscaviarum]|uniref:WGR domain-containing protein n=1 Tax=Nocardia otitidiscaviarum TaxID=1823 RepID=A0A379JHZ4_9NOCA|nr:SMI1/KNR4 family protein [Nocardia otitidiscaviarum]SUD48187.1 Uncharacterised protein [Nocardia otitidiscaviarum]